MHTPAPHQELENKELEKKRKIISIVSLVVAVLVILLLGWLLGRPLMQMIRNKESFRAWLQAHGPLKYFIMVGMMALQIIIAAIPGGPMEIAAGYAFGPWMGTFLCLLGSLIGTLIIFLLTRRFGLRMVQLFVSKDKMESIKLFNDRHTMYSALFLAFLIPGMPKDIITYFGGILPIGLWPFVGLTTLARAPSILLSAFGGHWLGEEEFGAAFFVLIIALAVTVVASLIYRHHTKKKTPRPAVPPAQGAQEISPAPQKEQQPGDV